MTLLDEFAMELADDLEKKRPTNDSSDMNIKTENIGE